MYFKTLVVHGRGREISILTAVGIWQTLRFVLIF